MVFFWCRHPPSLIPRGSAIGTHPLWITISVTSETREHRAIHESSAPPPVDCSSVAQASKSKSAARKAETKINKKQTCSRHPADGCLVGVGAGRRRPEKE